TEGPGTRRYDAACYAALAGCGQGEDAGKLTEAERAALRREARDWVRAELGAVRGEVQSGKPALRTAAVERLCHWRRRPDPAGVRDPEGLRLLPEADQQEWKQLWAEVEATLPKPEPWVHAP